MSPLGLAIGLATGAVVAPFSSRLVSRPPLRDQQNESLRAPARCSSCRTPVPPMRQIPVLSYLLARGRCASCGERMGAVELWNDALCLVIGAVTGALVGMNAALPGLLVLALVLVPMALIDLRLHKIPTMLVYPATAVVLALLGVAALVQGDPGRFVRAVGGGLAASAFLWILVIAYPAGMGDGDARLCLLLGMGLAWFGWIHVFYGVMAGFILGSVVGIGYAVSSGKGRKAQLPFGPWLGSGALAVILWAPHLPVLARA